MKQTSKHTTGFASEYYVLSILHRLGIDAFITLGNTKAIDIIINTDEDQKTIDVKGLRGKTGWLLGKNLPMVKKNHFIVLVSYMDAIENIQLIPECYIIPSELIESLTKYYPKKGYGVYEKAKLKEFKDNWDILTP